MRLEASRFNRAARAGLLWTAVLTMALSWLATTPANAQDFSTYTRATFDQWLEKNKDAKPDFKAGDSLTAKDIERLRPFIPPGFIEQLNFPEFKADIIEAKSHKPRTDYVECGEKYQNQTKLASDGALVNYVCGQPFPDSQVTLTDPNAGMKAAWNFDWRWQNFGLFITDVGWIWDRFGGTHVAPILTKPPELASVYRQPSDRPDREFQGRWDFPAHASGALRAGLLQPSGFAF